MVDETVQTPVVALVKATVRLLDAVALTVKVPVPMVLFDNAPKVMLWLDFETVIETEFEELAEL